MPVYKPGLRVYRSGMLRFTIFGIPTKIHWMFWVVCALLGGIAGSNMTPQLYQGVVIWIGVCFISILWHELGHALTARKYGARPDILLYGMGGLASYPNTGRITRNQRLQIIFWGPGFGLLLGGAVWLIAKFFLPPPREMNFHLWVLVTSLIRVNIFWSLVNLLPVLPLDGGQFMGAWMHDRDPRLRGQIGTGIGVAVALVALLNNEIYIAIMFGLLAYYNFQISEGKRVKFF